MISDAAFIHPKSHTDGTVTIGEGTSVWQFASVIRGAVVGEDCNIASAAMVDGAELGVGCLIGHGASVNPGFQAGRRVFIGPNATICNDPWPWAHKTGFSLDAVRAAGRWIVVAEEGASIGANAVILPGVRIGAGAMVAAGAVCKRDVPSRTLYQRNGRIVPLPADLGLEHRMRFVA